MLGKVNYKAYGLRKKGVAFCPKVRQVPKNPIMTEVSMPAAMVMSARKKSGVKFIFKSLCTTPQAAQVPKIRLLTLVTKPARENSANKVYKISLRVAPQTL